MSQHPYEERLAPYAMVSAASRGRAHAEPDHPFRPLYQRDRDRIIHCTAFRRLEYKTQVFVNHEGDHYRTRLTHTLEVAQISRTIARALALNEDLTEAIALAHDLGHTPFGHCGEDVLARLMHEHGGFEHNQQGLRVVDELERRYPAFPGLNLSYEVREAFVRHSTRHDFPAVPPEFQREEGILLEVQTTIVADEIAYDNHDIDDGLSSGILREEELREMTLWRLAIEACGETYDTLPAEMRRAAGVRSLINLLVTDVIDAARERLAAGGIETIADVRASRAMLIAPSAKVAPLKRELEQFLMERFYRHHRILRMARKAQRFLRELFNAYAGDPVLLPEEHQQRVAEFGRERAVCDYVAGMTDRYAEQECRNLFHPFEHF